jgi:hypothetical protein
VRLPPGDGMVVVVHDCWTVVVVVGAVVVVVVGAVVGVVVVGVVVGGVVAGGDVAGGNVGGGGALSAEASLRGVVEAVVVLGVATTLAGAVSLVRTWVVGVAAVSSAAA